MKWVIDRYEEDWAVLENMETGEPEDFPRSVMPKGSKPGSTVFMQDGQWVIDHEDTAARRSKIQSRFARIRKANGL